MSSTKTVQQYCTAKDTDQRLSKLDDIPLGDEVGHDLKSVTIDHATRFQTIEGFGGAFTEAAASTLYKMPPPVQQEILNAYFSPATGLGYSLCRTHINSCDFSLGNYAYCDVDGDMDLSNFSLERDLQALIPMIRDAKDVEGAAFKLFASPWSPPAWMKTTGKMNQGGKLKPECRDVWARYYARFIKEYAAEGIPIWGLTVQNEPEATQTWDSCIYTAEEERDFVRDHLGPTLHEEGLADVKLMVWDHNRDNMVKRAKVVFDDAEASKYVWGTAFHWYVDDKFENVQILHDAYPDKKLLFSEGCQEGGPHIGEWGLGERYARSMISDLNKWTVAWVDWNLILDETGGPNHVGNLCSAPIIADTQVGAALYQSSYYYIGHFARFIKPGAERIVCATTADALEATAFVNTDGRTAVVVVNRSEEDIPFALECEAGVAKTVSPKRSIKTLVLGG